MACCLFVVCLGLFVLFLLLLVVMTYGFLYCKLHRKFLRRRRQTDKHRDQVALLNYISRFLFNAGNELLETRITMSAIDSPTTPPRSHSLIVVHRCPHTAAMDSGDGTEGNGNVQKSSTAAVRRPTLLMMDENLNNNSGYSSLQDNHAVYQQPGGARAAKRSPNTISGHETAVSPTVEWTKCSDHWRCHP